MLRLHALGHTSCLILRDKSFSILIVPGILDLAIWSVDRRSDLDSLFFHLFNNHADLLSILLLCFPYWLDLFIIMRGRRFSADTPLVFPTNKHCTLVAKRDIGVAWHQKLVTLLLVQ